MTATTSDKLMFVVGGFVPGATGITQCPRSQYFGVIEPNRFVGIEGSFKF